MAAVFETGDPKSFKLASTTFYSRVTMQGETISRLTNNPVIIALTVLLKCHFWLLKIVPPYSPESQTTLNIRKYFDVFQQSGFFFFSKA